MLRGAFPEAGWLSEETEDDPARLDKTTLLVLDPIDGTRAFMTGDPCWTVAIALVEDGRPIAGVVHAPALGETFAASLGRGATLNGEPFAPRRLEALDGVRVAGPRATRGRFRRVRRIPAGAGPANALARLSARQRRRRHASRSASPAPIRTIGTSAPPTSSCARRGRGSSKTASEVRYNQPRTRHDPLLAAPVEWLARLAPALRAALAPPGRRA